MTTFVRDLEGAAAPVLAKMSWAVALRAVAAIGFAFAAFFWLGKSLTSLTLLFAGYAAVDGALSLAAAMRGGGFVTRSGLTLAGAVSVAAGFAAAFWIGAGAATLATMIGAWAIARGALEFAGALKLRRYMQRDWSLVMIAGVSMAFGVLLILSRELDAWTHVRLLSGYLLVLGMLLALLAYRFVKAPRP